MPVANPCACDVCDAWIDADHRSDLCEPCGARCYPVITIDGKPQRSSLTYASRLELHRLRKAQDPVASLGHAIQGVVREHGPSLLQYALRTAIDRIVRKI